ncbi:MAG: protein kinase [Thermoguttaceae bacterium]|jgi:hypothetical protein|nr:protein kinase [Thermoguttaceae bacterium]
MSTDPTELQRDSEREQARERSLHRTHPPVQVPGYDPERLLGGGAYGEVWLAVERNTGRRVAIKFYAHRGGLDWSLLSREVEKLAFLFADRYVVQLLAVGWEAEPPYYVMEYIERGSLADRLREGPMRTAEAVDLMRDVAIGLVHAHAKGILHCDLKPANILLDQDGKPRLADFGQSRLSTEQTPALGTLFYMAPEQADLESLPDARWDVYALGALLYCMLTGTPPHRTDESAQAIDHAVNLTRRLSRYRKMIQESPLPTAHRRVKGVDADLAAIVDRCLAPDPEQRFPTVQAVLDALAARDRRRAQRPLVLLGTVGPALLLLVVSLFFWQGFSAALRQSNAALTDRAIESNRFAAQFVARTVGEELQRRWAAVNRVAASTEVKEALAGLYANPDVIELMQTLSDPGLAEAEAEPLREQFRNHPARKTLEAALAAAIPAFVEAPDDVASWFLCDARGLSTVRLPAPTTVGRNYAWRSFFHGGPADLDPAWRPGPDERLQETGLSAVFRSQATNHWIVAVSTPVFSNSAEKKFLGVVALTVELGRFVELEGSASQFAVLVDWRDGPHKGVIIQHPLFNRLIAEQGKLPDRVKDYLVTPERLPDTPTRQRTYRDPVAADPEGVAYNRAWLAHAAPVELRTADTGWVVIVQEAYDEAIGRTLFQLRAGLIHYGIIALALVGLVMVVLWIAATRLSRA